MATVPPSHQATGTAADLLSYTSYVDSNTLATKLTRTATADETWLINILAGITIEIKFDNNFSKKHLFTFSKSQAETALRAGQIAGRADRGSDLENWNRAEHELLSEKVRRISIRRSEVQTCGDCGHSLKKHQTGGSALTACKEIKGSAQCGCTWKTKYAMDRRGVGKVYHNPVFTFAVTHNNTILILNYVPKAEFENALVTALAVADGKPWQNFKGKPTQDIVIDFGFSRNGVIRTVHLENDLSISSFDRPQHRAIFTVERGAQSVDRKTYTIVHLKEAP